MTPTLATVVLAAGEGPKNPLLPVLGELVIGAVTFLVLLLVMSRGVFPRANRMLRERSANIEGRLDEAARRLQEAEALAERNRAELEQAHEEAARIVAEGRRRGEETRVEVVARAEGEVARMHTRATEQIEAERVRAVTEVRQDVSTLAVELAERLLGESLDEHVRSRVLDRFLDDLVAQETGATPARGGARG